MIAGLASVLFALFVLFAGGIPSAHAQGLALGGGTGGGPIEVEADQGIEWRRDEKVIIARGNAQATRGENSVAADKLTAHYREVDGRQEIHRFEAEGDVVIRTGQATFYGDRALYEADRGSMIIFGDPVRAERPGERLVAQESIEFRIPENVAVARGDVRADRGDQKLSAETVTARFVEVGDSGLELRQIEADGNVILSTPTDIARARHATYDVKSEVATLTGSVKITHGKNQLNGDVAEVNLRTGISRLKSAGGASGGGRVRALLVPEGSADGTADGR